MTMRCGIAFGLILVCVWSGLAAGQPMYACALLTSTEIGTAMGTPAGPSQESAMVVPEGPAKGETMSMCRWPMGEQGMLSISVIRAPQGAQREAGLAQLSRMFETLKAQGWTEERKDFGTSNSRRLKNSSNRHDIPVGFS
jgi:hypothetical protein